jgi:hypothetical protein
MNDYLNSPISERIVAKIIFEENIPRLHAIINEELGFSVVEMLNEKKSDYCGVVFTRQINGVKVDLYVGFFRPEYGCRDVLLRTKSIEMFKFLNKELALYFTAKPRYDGNVEYESNEFYRYKPLHLFCVSYNNGDYGTSIKRGSHFSTYSKGSDYYKDESKEMKAVFGIRSKGFWG